jgi:hypothetical protein
MSSPRHVLLASIAMWLPAAAAHAQGVPQVFRAPLPGTMQSGTDRSGMDQESRNAQREMAVLDAALDEADKLTPEQSERLIRLLQDVQQVPWSVLQSPTDSGFVDRPLLHPKGWPRWERDQYLASLEAELRIAQQRADLLLDRLPRFLSARQVLTYARLQAEDLTRRHARIDSVRSALGIPDPTIAEWRSRDDRPL